jgi:hypothetical protein
MLENMRTGQKRVYSSRTELSREKAIKVPYMDKPFFSKVHEVYFKATPVRGNGYDDITHCAQETAAEKSSLQLAVHEVSAKSNKRATTNKKRFQGRSLLLKTDKLIESDKLVSFMAGVESGGATNDGYVVLKTTKQMNFQNGEVSIAKRLGLESGDIQMLSEYEYLPDEFLIKYMNGDYDPTVWRHRFGKMQCDEYMKTVSKMTVETLKNRIRTKSNKERPIIPPQMKEQQEMQFIPCCSIHCNHSAP